MEPNPKKGDAKMKCLMCSQPASYLVNQVIYLCNDCFNPNDSDVQQLEMEGLIYEEIGGGDENKD